MYFIYTYFLNFKLAVDSHGWEAEQWRTRPRQLCRVRIEAILCRLLGRANQDLNHVLLCHSGTATRDKVRLLQFGLSFLPTESNQLTGDRKSNYGVAWSTRWCLLPRSPWRPGWWGRRSLGPRRCTPPRARAPVAQPCTLWKPPPTHAPFGRWSSWPPTCRPGWAAPSGPTPCGPWRFLRSS